MAQRLYKPLQTLNFSKQRCFLTGQKLESADHIIPVFPNWIMDQYELHDKAFKLLDESMSTYQSMQVPCDISVIKSSIDSLEAEIQNAFLSGYDEVVLLPELRLFQWIGKLIYGLIFNEIRIGIRQQQANNEEFVLSQSLIHKFENLHIMLQSLVHPIEFEENMPWTIQIFKLQDALDQFNYRDEINTLTFSLSMKDFGIIACLQDNGTNGNYNRPTLEKIAGKSLHPIQFQEVCARFFYSNYLFNRLPEYTIMEVEDTIFIESMPLRGMSSKPLFDIWNNKTYAQVLENFWKPWGILLFEVLKDPENPMTFLFDGEGEFISPDKVVLPS